MTIADLIVVYLSCGAPFGVLVFLSRHSRPTIRTIAQSFLAATFWPLVAISWIHRRLLLGQQGRRSTYSPLPKRAIFSQDPLFAEYETLTRAMLDARTAESSLSAELFELAGNANPRLAAVCSERKRNRLLEHRQAASAAALIEHITSGQLFSDENVRTIAQHCRDLGDLTTARSNDDVRSGTDEKRIAIESTAEPVRLAA